MQAMLDVQSPSASASEPGSSPAPRAERAERIGFWLFASHLFSVFGIALSNILLAVSVLAAPRTVRRPLALRELAPLFVPLGLYGLLMVAALAAAYGLGQYLFGYGDLDRRIRGTFSHYMTFAGFLLICDLLLLASMTFSGRWRQPWRWVALALVNVALVGSYTRGAWVAFGCALTVLLIVRAPRLLLAYVPAAALFILLAPVPLLQRVGSIADLRDSSNYDRLCMASAGLTMIQERPLFGIGPEGVKRRYAIYRPATAPRYLVPHLHNSFLNLAAERGLPALASYLALTLVSAGLAWRRYVREGGRHGPRADLWMGVLLALFAFNVAGLFENNWGDTEVQRPLLFVLALPFCLLAGGREREETEAGPASSPVTG
jgi:O-antigen ligase